MNSIKKKKWNWVRFLVLRGHLLHSFPPHPFFPILPFAGTQGKNIDSLGSVKEGKGLGGALKGLMLSGHAFLKAPTDLKMVVASEMGEDDRRRMPLSKHAHYDI